MNFSCNRGHWAASAAILISPRASWPWVPAVRPIGENRGRLLRRVAEPSDPLGAHGRGDRLDRNLLLLHGARLHAFPARAPEPRRSRHRMAGAWRWLLSR